MLKSKIIFLFAFFLTLVQVNKAQSFVIDSMGYFINGGVNVMAFDDIYPEGHQGGIGIIMHGDRVAANGDLRLESTPGQWQPIPIQKNRKIDKMAGVITVNLSYPDTTKHQTGFNPLNYPDLEFDYEVRIQKQGESILVIVDLNQPIPSEFLGKVGFNIELYPGHLFGKGWLMDQQSGVFPIQPNGPTNYTYSENDVTEYHPQEANKIIAAPYAVGKKLIIQPNDPYKKLTIESLTSNLELIDGRLNHNNGWFVVRSEIAEGATKGAVKWLITPNAVKDWLYTPVIQISQLGYHPNQQKQVVIELDRRDDNIGKAHLIKLTESGEELMKELEIKEWGSFLRYDYLKADFSDIVENGLYQIVYGTETSDLFRISDEVYERGAWQPVLEYFLPVQMCHMRVNEKYRVWHGCCHMDDAQMAQTSHNHFDGYIQGESTLTKFKSGEPVPGINIGGWHDAGDYDLRVESQSGEVYMLCLTKEAFGISYDQTSVNQDTRITEIHQPDGKDDLLQQIEHGTLSVVGGYRSLGRLYRGIICNRLRQYVMLGEASVMTDHIIGNENDRWVFTEDNPQRELSTAAHLAAAARVLKGFNDILSHQSLQIAKVLFETADKNEREKIAKIHAATELFLSTKDEKYRDYILSQQQFIVMHINQVGWFIGRADTAIANKKFSRALLTSLQELNENLEALSKETPYGIPYKPYIWGAGWGIQAMGFEHYFLHKSYPGVFSTDLLFNSLNFVLGCHPGKNTKSFASGVGTNSATVAYGVNRGDWSFIPGGVISGTALIRPDFPELLDFPFLWQQTEYVMGGGSSHYMFLVLAAQQLL